MNNWELKVKSIKFKVFSMNKAKSYSPNLGYGNLLLKELNF